MLRLFSAALFLSSFVLFLVQPMAAKMILPLLGGSPLVWNTAVVFFQFVLLLGYLYAHLSSTIIPFRYQGWLHGALFVAAVGFLPIEISVTSLAAPPYESHPVGWVLLALIRTVAAPFFVVTATAPLLQAWYARSGQQSSDDPYFLYSASNFGGLIAILSYPLWLEPWFDLTGQSWIWAAGFGLTGGLIIVCAVASGRSQGQGRHAPSPEPAAEAGQVTSMRRLYWFALAFAPSSLMLGVTTYLTTDLAAIPLLWLIPLALYLVSFMMAFARRPLFEPSQLRLAALGGSLALILLILLSASQPLWLVLPLHVAVFFVIALACHGHLARLRPPVKRLTEFYLWIGLGGVLGGSFNAILAPIIFTSVMEYPLALLLACALQPRDDKASGAARRPWSYVRDPLAIGGVTAILILTSNAWFAEEKGFSPALLFAFPILLSVRIIREPQRFSLGLLALLVAMLFHTGPNGRIIHEERNYFGVSRVTDYGNGRFHRFVNGTTVHGIQSLDPSHRGEPLAYYHNAGPAGDIFRSINRSARGKQIAIIGLGAGSLVSYARPDQEWTIYEIDPAVVRIAREERYFTFLKQAQTKSPLRILVGDARLRLQDANAAHFSLILIDAFSSDAIPVHLVTREAIDLYLSKLVPDGMLAFNISNRHLNLRPVLAGLAADAGLEGYSRRDALDVETEERTGRASSQWVVMARKGDDVRDFASDRRWIPLAREPWTVIWTDRYSSVVQLLNRE